MGSLVNPDVFVLWFDLDGCVVHTVYSCVLGCVLISLSYNEPADSIPSPLLNTKLRSGRIRQKRRLPRRSVSMEEMKTTYELVRSDVSAASDGSPELGIRLLGRSADTVLTFAFSPHRLPPTLI